MERAHGGLRPVDVVLTSAQISMPLRKSLTKSKELPKGPWCLCGRCDQRRKINHINAIVKKSRVTRMSLRLRWGQRTQIEIPWRRICSDTPVILLTQMAHATSWKPQVCRSKNQTQNLSTQSWTNPVSPGGLGRFDFIAGEKQRFYSLLWQWTITVFQARRHCLYW